MRCVTDIYPGWSHLLGSSYEESYPNYDVPTTAYRCHPRLRAYRGDRFHLCDITHDSSPAASSTFASRRDVAPYPCHTIFHLIHGYSSSTATLLWWQHNDGMAARPGGYDLPWVGMHPWRLSPYGGGYRTDGPPTASHHASRNHADSVLPAAVQCIRSCANGTHDGDDARAVSTRQRWRPPSPDERQHAPPVLHHLSDGHSFSESVARSSKESAAAASASTEQLLLPKYSLRIS